MNFLGYTGILNLDKRSQYAIIIVPMNYNIPIGSE